MGISQHCPFESTQAALEDMHTRACRDSLDANKGLAPLIKICGYSLQLLRYSYNLYDLFPVTRHPLPCVLLDN